MGKYGKVDWATAPSKSQNQNSLKGKYFKLNNGKNKVRFVSAAYKFFIHKVKFPNDVHDNYRKYGRDIKCAEDNCPLCAENNPAKEKYLVALIPDGGDEIKYLKLGKLLYEKILDIKENMPGYTNALEYDLNLVRNGGSPANFYSAFPIGPENRPLTAEELRIIEEQLDEAEMEKIVAAPTPEEVTKSIESITAWIAKENKKNSGHAESEDDDSSAGRSNSHDEEEDDDDDYSFKKRTK